MNYLLNSGKLILTHVLDPNADETVYLKIHGSSFTNKRKTVFSSNQHLIVIQRFLEMHFVFFKNRIYKPFYSYISYQKGSIVQCISLY